MPQIRQNVLIKLIQKYLAKGGPFEGAVENAIYTIRSLRMGFDLRYGIFKIWFSCTAVFLGPGEAVKLYSSATGELYTVSSQHQHPAW